MIIAEDRRSRAHVDIILLLMVFAMAFFSVLAVCIATYSPGSTAETLLHHIAESNSAIRQCVFLILAPIIVSIIMNIPYDLLRRWAVPLYIAGTLLIFVVWIFNRAEGVKQWLDIIWGFTIQPTEFAKLSMILVLAKYLSRTDQPMNTVSSFVTTMALVLVPGTIILLSGETGSLMVIIFLAAVMMFFSGVRMRILVGLGLFALLLVASLYGFMVATGSTDYRLARITAFFDPSTSPLNDAYQQNMSKMAIGSGGLTGIGMFVDGAISQLNYVPADWTDFIYATIGEAFGFVGCFSILIWYLLIILRMIYLAAFTRDKFGMLVICGVTGMLLFHIFENIGMTIGVTPITGIPLPFLSYGGSNMVTNMGGIALVLNVTKNRSLSSDVLAPQTRVNPYSIGKRIRSS